MSEPGGCPWAVQGLASGGRLVALYSTNTLVEYRADGHERVRIPVPGGPMSVRRLDNGNTLVACNNAQKVVRPSVSDDDSANVAYSATFNGEEDIYYVRIDPSLPPTDFNGDARPDLLLFNATTRQTAVWYMNNNVRIGSANGPILPGGWSVASVADFNRDDHPDYLLFNTATRATWIWYMNNNVRIGNAFGPTLPAGWTVVALGDFNSDGYPDYVLFNANTGGTIVWYMRNNVRIGSAPARPFQLGGVWLESPISMAIRTLIICCSMRPRVEQ